MGSDDRGLIEDMDAHGIDTAWLLFWEIALWEDARSCHAVLNPLNTRPDSTHAGIPLRDLLTAHRNNPRRFLPRILCRRSVVAFAYCRQNVSRTRLGRMEISHSL